MDSDDVRDLGAKALSKGWGSCGYCICWI